MLPRAKVLHSLPGRTRLGFPTAKGSAVLISRLVDGLRALPQVVEATGSPVTGAILVRHSGTIESIGALGRDVGLFELKEPQHQAETNVQVRAAQGLRQLSSGLETVTGGQVDLNGLLVVAFTLLAIQQAIEGQVVVPAATALWYALNASRSPDQNEKNGSREGGLP
jgi:hypothetical protein